MTTITTKFVEILLDILNLLHFFLWPSDCDKKLVAVWPSKPTSSKKWEMKNVDNVWWSDYYYPCQDPYDCKGSQEKGLLGLWDWFHGYIQNKNKPQRDAKTSPNGAQSIFGGFSRVPLLDATLDIPQNLVCFGYPNGFAPRCLINTLHDFLALHPCRASNKFIQLEWIS